MSVAELANHAGCEVLDLTPPVILRPTPPRGAIYTRRGLILAVRGGDFWFAATAKKDGAGGLDWLVEPPCYGSRSDALRAASETLRKSKH